MKKKNHQDLLEKKNLRAMWLQCTVMNVRRASRLLTNMFDDTYRQYGIRGTQFSLLSTIAYYNGDTITNIAKGAMLDRTTMSRNLALLEKQGLVTIRDADEGGNQKKVLITKAGKALFQRGYSAWNETQEKIKQTIGEENWRQLIHLLLLMEREMS